MRRTINTSLRKLISTTTIKNKYIMKTNTANICENCEKPYPQIGYFCGGCLTQFKCKSCDSILEINNLGCTNCGTPKESKNDKSTSESQNVNTFRLHETLSDRTIEATFSDNVGKDLAGVIRDAYSAKLGVTNNNYGQLDVVSKNHFQDEVIENESINQPIDISSDNIKQAVTSTLNEYPTLTLVSMKHLPKTETEWVVVYSFFASNFGTEIFHRNNIIDKHKESKRKHDNYVRDLSSYIKLAVKAGYINPLEDGYFLFEDGINKAKEVISRTTGTIPSLKNSQKKTKEEEIKGSKESKSSKNNSETKSLKRLAEINFDIK